MHPLSSPRRHLRLNYVHEPLEWVESDHPRGVGDEVRQRIDIVEVGLAVALVDKEFDAANV